GSGSAASQRFLAPRTIPLQLLSHLAAPREVEDGDGPPCQEQLACRPRSITPVVPSSRHPARPHVCHADGRTTQTETIPCATVISVYAASRDPVQPSRVAGPLCGWRSWRLAWSPQSTSRKPTS